MISYLLECLSWSGLGLGLSWSVTKFEFEKWRRNDDT